MLRGRLAVVFAAAALLIACTQVTAAADYYELLGVPPTATNREIKRAYRKKALELHPDKLGREVTEEDEQAFIDVVKAYEVLSDADQRRRYDAYGPEESEGATIIVKSYHQYPFDMYVSLPGGAFEFHWKPAQKPSAGTLTVSVTITLEECYSGVDKEVNITRQRICPVCRGTGAHSHEHSKPCSVCEGHGWHLYLAEKSEGYKHVVNKTCEYCHGTGNQPELPCEHCGGRRVAQVTDTVNVNVKPGTPSGTSINLRDGPQAIGHTDGAVNVQVHVQPHPKFKLLANMDLLYETKITLIDALIGFTRYLTLLNGTRLTVVHDTVTFAGYRMTYSGLGMPSPSSPGEYSDLIIEFSVAFPRRLSEDQREILRDIMDEQEIEILESVIKLAMARDADIAGANMPLEETYHCSQCDPSDPFICVPDPVRTIEWESSRSRPRRRK